MKTLKDHQDTMVSMLASGTAIPTSAIRLAHALHDVLAHLNNTNVAPVAHTERRIEATTPGLNDAMLAQDIAAVKPKRQSPESLLKQRDNTIRQLKGRVADLVKERDELKYMLGADPAYFREPEQAGCRKQDTQAVDDGWVEWGGGSIAPVDGVVEVRWSTGSTGIGHARDFRWEHSRYTINIIAYRVVKS